MDKGDVATLAQVISGGGLLAFAAVVWGELKLIRPVLVNVQKSLVAILEHVRPAANDEGSKS